MRAMTAKVAGLAITAAVLILAYAWLAVGTVIAEAPNWRSKLSSWRPARITRYIERRRYVGRHWVTT
jgi:hypothetical protein